MWTIITSCCHDMLKQEKNHLIVWKQNGCILNYMMWILTMNVFLHKTLHWIPLVLYICFDCNISVTCWRLLEVIVMLLFFSFFVGVYFIIEFGLEWPICLKVAVLLFCSLSDSSTVNIWQMLKTTYWDKCGLPYSGLKKMNSACCILDFQFYCSGLTKAQKIIPTKRLYCKTKLQLIMNLFRMWQWSFAYTSFFCCSFGSPALFLKLIICKY